MALNSGKILMRRGQEVNFDPNKMMPGEWAVSLDNKYVRMCFQPGVCVRMATYDAFEADMVQIQRILAECQTIEEAVERINDEISVKAQAVAEYTAQAKQYRDEAEQFRNEAEIIAGFSGKYEDLSGKPKINDIELSGSKTAEELGLQEKGDYLTEESIISFEESGERINIETNDSIKGIFGKIAKWFSDLKTVAFTGKYEDLEELPTIPSKTSELENDSKYISTANILDSYMEIESNTEFNQFAGALGVKEGIVNVEQRITDVATVTEVKDGLPNYSGESLLPSIDCCFINYFDGYYVTGYIKKSLGRVELTLFMSKDAQLWDSIKRFILNGENYAPVITCSIVNKNTMLIGAYAEKDSIPGKIINITSNNGEWEVKVSSINDKITSLAYGKGMYIAVSNNQARIYSSTDGTLFNCVKSISSVTSGWNYVFTSVIYSEYGFVAVGYREILENGVLGITQMYATSIDGNTWSDNIYRESGDYRGTVFNSVAYNDGNFFVVGDDLSYVLIASAEDVFSNVHDEDTWLSGWNMPLYYGDVNSKILCINNVFITLGYSELKPGGVVCVSPNGISDWEYMSGIPEDISNIKDIVYHEGEIIIIDNMGKEFLLSFEKIRSNINDYTKEHLINEKNESFYFGFNGKDRGFFTGRNRSSENFYPFLQNASQIMQRGEIKITSTSDDATFVPMERNCVYMMPVVDITISNGAIRGYRTYIIYTSEDPSTGVGVILKSTLASGGTGQLSITDIKEVDRVGVNIKPNNVAYKTMYTLIKLM